MIVRCLQLFGLLFIGAAAQAGEIRVDVDAALASRLLEISCSNQEVDETEFANSDLLKRQFAHHARFGEEYSLENYLHGVRSIARCEVPDPDPFRFGALVERRDEMASTIAFLSGRREELGEKVAALIAPYVPEDVSYSGSVVLAPASFSCGGFASGGSFFIDLPCIAADVEGEYEAIARLIAHETYHAVQGRFVPDFNLSFSGISSPAEAHELMFLRLAVEGSASYVGNMLNVEGDARYARFSRELARRNYGHLAYNFRLFNYVMELLGEPHPDYNPRFRELHGLAFDGAFGERSYFVGQQMAAEIDKDFGGKALACVLSLPPENFALAYEKALATGEKLGKSSPLSTLTLEAARRLAATRTQPADLEACLG